MPKALPEVALVMPQQPGLLEGFATGLLCLGNYLRAREPDCRIEIMDFCSAEPAMIERDLAVKFGNDRSRPLIVGITTTTASYQNALHCATIARGIRPDCFVVLGGPHASADADHVLRHHRDLVNAVVVGEGERALLELVRNFSQLEKVSGLAFFDAENRLRRNPAPTPLSPEELDELPITWRGEVPLRAGKFHCTTYVSARGCPLHCAFCSVANAKIRAKSVPRVKEDIRELVKRGHVKISVEDNFFGQSPVRTKAICAALAELREEGLHFEWDCQTRIESLVRPGAVAELKRAGCYAVYMGVESLTERTLRYLKKTNQPARYVSQLVDTVVPALLAERLGCNINLQFGVLGETASEYQAAIAILAKCGKLALAAGMSVVVFPQLSVVYPGTRHYEEGVAQSRFPAAVFEAFTEWEARQEPVLHWLGEHFAHGTGGLPEGILDAAALRTGRFEVNLAAVLELSARLTALNRIPGVEVFRYGNHLTSTKKAS